VVHTLAGAENKVKIALQNRAKAFGLKDKVTSVLVPTEDVAEVRGGKKRITTRKFFPGYVMVEIELEDDGKIREDVWYLVRRTPGVTGFVGAGSEPVPLSEEEVERILKTQEEKKGKVAPKVIFEKGDGVKVVEGPFMNLSGVVEEVYPERGKLKVMVSIFGRQTPVELEYWQVERI